MLMSLMKITTSTICCSDETYTFPPIVVFSPMVFFSTDGNDDSEYIDDNRLRQVIFNY